jgi:hypothetical protein
MLNAVRCPFLPDPGFGSGSENAAFPVPDLLFGDDLLQNRYKRAASELPLADTDRCLPILQDRLAESNCQKMSPRRRMRVARVVTAMAELLIGRVAAELAGADFPIAKGVQGRHCGLTCPTSNTWVMFRGWERTFNTEP